MSETKHAMKLRHKAELKALQSQKYTGIGAAKRQKEDEKALIQKQQQEIQQIDKTERETLTNTDTLPPSLSAAVVLSRAEKRRAAKENKQEQTRREILAAVNADNDLPNVDPRKVEMEQLDDQLKPLNLYIKEIVSDGHCLFRALADQMERHTHTLITQIQQQQQQALSLPLYHCLRLAAAQHIRSHLSLFLPFLLSDDGETMTDQQALEYCNALEDFSAQREIVWGGHIEIVALSEYLQHPVIVYTARAKELRVTGLKTQTDNENTHDSGSISSIHPLRISFHKHYFGLGNHYNSVIETAVDDVH